MNYVTLSFLRLHHLHTCELMHECVTWWSKKPERKPTYKHGGMTANKAGWVISTSQPSGNLMWASSENIQGSLTPRRQCRLDESQRLEKALVMSQSALLGSVVFWCGESGIMTEMISQRWISVCHVHLDLSTSILREDERTIADTETKWRPWESRNWPWPFRIRAKISAIFICQFLFLRWRSRDRRGGFQEFIEKSNCAKL